MRNVDREMADATDIYKSKYLHPEHVNPTLTYTMVNVDTSTTR